MHMVGQNFAYLIFPLSIFFPHVGKEISGHTGGLTNHPYVGKSTRDTPLAPSMNTSSATSTLAAAMSEFDKHRETLLSDDLEEGWASELDRYLNMMQRDVKKDTDIVEWWQVRTVVCPYPSSANPSSVEPCLIISYARSYCTQRPPISSFICAM